MKKDKFATKSIITIFLIYSTICSADVNAKKD
jgi:hypothetical protein